MAPSNIALLGVDLGTSSVKALVVSQDGQILGHGAAEYPIQRLKPDWAEQSPQSWWQATVVAVQKAMAEANRPAGAIAAVGLSGQMHGTVLLDRAGKLLHPAVIWPDQRSRRQVTELSAAIGQQRLIQLTGSPLATGFQAATIRWFQQTRPAIWQKTARVLAPKDYLRWRMTGEFTSEPSDGSGTLLLNVHQRNWSTEILAAVGVERRVLPEIRPSTAVAGHLTREAADQLGLPVHLPVVTGAADTACGLLGSGVVDEGSLLLTISSGGQLAVPASKAIVDLDGRLHTFCGALEATQNQPGWYQMAAILAAGLSLRWLRDQVFELAGDHAYETMNTLAEQAPPGARGLLFLPYLLGERTPHMDTTARGLFLGLTAGHGRAELVRAVMEGVALACLDAFEVLAEVGARPDHVVMAGGGARSRVWRQIVADVFDLPVRPLAVSEQAALGAALLAGAGLGLFEPGAAAIRWSSFEAMVAPDEEAHTTYRDLLAIFRAAYRKHVEDFKTFWRM